MGRDRKVVRKAEVLIALATLPRDGRQLTGSRVGR
jgi:hypothetical protein